MIIKKNRPTEDNIRRKEGKKHKNGQREKERERQRKIVKDERNTSAMKWLYESQQHAITI